MGLHRNHDASRAAILLACLAAWLLAVPVAAFAPSAAQGQEVGDALGCPALDALGPAADPDLYCIELIHAPDFPGAVGHVELTPPSSPFGVSVTVDGRHRFDLTFHIDGLPDPASLGDYTGYVAWATTPRLRPVVNLGPVGNGRTTVGPVDLNKFVLLVTAEADPNAPAWDGRIVLRGTSAGRRMEPEDLLAVTGMVAGAELPPPARGWTRPPMHPSVAMMPGVGRLTPPVDPFLPAAADPLPAARPRAARPREIVRLGDGGTLDLEAGLVERTIDGRTFTMYGFNGQYPGPLIQVPQDATITVNVTNRLELPTAVHWHGIRLENRYDGVPGLTQDPIEPGETFQYRIHFPDAGLYWYHPHHREDVQQDLGLHGNLRVDAADPEYFGPANREEVLMLDDLLVDEAGLAPFGRQRATHAMMGRFGNLLLVNGEPDYRLTVARGEVVRFFLTNVSNTRTFNLSFGGAAIKVVASDIGKFERQDWVDSVVIAPAERYIVEVRFDTPGEAPLVNRVQAIDHVYGNFFPDDTTLGTVTVTGTRAAPDHAASFRELRDHPDVTADIDRYRDEFDRPVDHRLLLTLEIGELPDPIEPLLNVDRSFFNPVEWSGTMPRMNWVTTADQVRWILRDLDTGLENDAIDWRFTRGDVVRIRLRNDRNAVHAMQHPVHIHGQRFLVLSRDGVPNDNLVWKDTTLLPAGSTADLLLELSNPGRWMLHCHISEHLESGMKLVFDVAGGPPSGRP
ncbi:MAG: multicopper oxidase family protein [Acidobacteria bacterium]|nr:multicopper oxidase family protein [Acidobacteriota bacterium]MYJ04520.1 multicopper oxidase family protein [Acidobacteriota bacterium]